MTPLVDLMTLSWRDLRVKDTNTNLINNILGNFIGRRTVFHVLIQAVKEMIP
jgi:hypothetical protein